MINSIEVPKNLMGSFKRVARRIPVGLKNDEDLVKTIVAYLQLPRVIFSSNSPSYHSILAK